MKINFTTIILTLFVKTSLFAQLDSITNYLETAKQSYTKGDYATSTVAYQTALNYAQNLKQQGSVKDSLQLTALKGLITVSGMGSAMQIASKYFTKHKTIIFKDLGSSRYRAIQIGLINNYIAVCYHNQDYKKAIATYKQFIKEINTCDNFRDVNRVQATANAVLAYAELNKTSEAIRLLPLLKYYKDSLINWTDADYEKVLANVKAKSGASPKEIIAHYKNAATSYETKQNYRYAFNVYETLLVNYVSYMSTEDLINLVNRSKIAQAKSAYYHNEHYDNMMKQFGLVLLEKNQIEEANKSLRQNTLLAICISLVLIIIFLVYLNQKSKEKKVIYKKLYTTERQLKQQREKLSALKNNFIKNNYSITENGLSSKSFFELYESLIKDFPSLNYNINERYPDLSKKEIQMIYLSLLDLSNKECANLLHLTYGSYRVAKNRLTKKMNCRDKDHFETSIKKLLS